MLQCLLDAGETPLEDGLDGLEVQVDNTIQTLSKDSEESQDSSLFPYYHTPTRTVAYDDSGVPEGLR